jgi:glycosyltransferase involved in cell wall biosynthesis
VNAGVDSPVDVVVPVRDGARYVASCLDSIMAQTMPVRAAIVVDDGSTDGTAAIVESYTGRWPALRLVSTGKRGLSHARNTGIANCQARFVAFIDSDDVWEPSKLEQQMHLFSTAPSRVGVVHCGYYLIDETGRRLDGRRIVNPRRRRDLLHDLLLEGNIVSGSGSAVVVRRELLERSGGFDEGLMFAEDWDLWLRLAEVAEFDFVPQALVGIRQHHHSMQRGDVSQKKVGFLLQTLVILDRWYLTPRFPRQLRDEYRWRAADLAMHGMRGPGALWSRQLDLYRKIKFGASRFGRELFSSPLDFLAEVYGPVPLARRLLVKIARRGLSAPRYEGLKDFVRSHRDR